LRNKQISDQNLEIGAAAAFLSHFSSGNNPLLHQIVMEASRPKFQGSAENFSEFRRQWREYHATLKSTFQGIGEGQMLQIFKTCLDPATALQLKREWEENPKLTVGAFMAVMEGDFGRDFSTQAREEWRCIKLVKNGPNLTVKDWRAFQLQFEVAADRVEDKGDREEYDLLYDQLSPFWQEKVIKEERTRPEGKNWVRISSVGVLSKDELVQILEGRDIQFYAIQDRGTAVLVQCCDSKKTPTWR
jgi:hypothetical protein